MIRAAGAARRVPVWLPLSLVAMLVPTAWESQASDPILLSRNTTGVPSSRSGAERMARRLANGSDLIAVGRISAVGPDSAPPFRFMATLGRPLRVTITLERLLRGYTTDRTMTYSASTNFSGSTIAAGRRILVPLSRHPELAGALVGGLIVIGDKGVLFSDSQSSSGSYAFSRDPRPLRLRDLPLEVLQRHDVRSLFDGPSAVAVMRFGGTSRVRAGVAWPSDSAGWVLGSGDRLPPFVRFGGSEQCGGDPTHEYLIPVPARFEGDTLFVDACPELLRIVNGQVPAFGVPFEKLSTVLAIDDRGTIEVRGPAWAMKRR